MDLLQDTRDRVVVAGAKIDALEAKIILVSARLDVVSTRLDVLIEVQQQAVGAVKVSRWLGHGITALIAYGVAKGASLISLLPRI